MILAEYYNMNVIKLNTINITQFIHSITKYPFITCGTTSFTFPLKALEDFHVFFHFSPGIET